MAIASSGSLPRPVLPAGMIRAVAVALLGLLALGAGLAGLNAGRWSLVGGIAAEFTQVAHVALGVVGTVVLAVLAWSRRRSHERVTWIIVAAVGIGWLSWIAGNVVAVAQGPGAHYAGTARITVGSKVFGAVPIGCSSVIGDPTLLSGLGVQTDGFELLLRHGVDRTVEPSISGSAILPGASIFFSTVKQVADDGLTGRATIESEVAPEFPGPTDVTIEWACDPATEGPGR